MKANRKWIFGLAGTGLLAVASILPATAGASLCQSQSAWGQILYCGVEARGHAYSNYNAFGVPGLKGLYAYMGGSGAYQVSAAGKNSSGSIIATCKAQDTTNDGNSVVTAGFACANAVSQVLQIGYY